MTIAVDNRQVVLLKSRSTNNRFYTLVEPNSGYRNADAIDDFPPHLPLGIAYPCLEDGLNDFAVIRTTFETIDVFRDDEELCTEMMGIIADSRGKLTRRLEELRDRIVAGQAHFLGTDLQEFKDHVLHMATRGTIRRQLDSMMKVDVFESVAKAESPTGRSMDDPMYRYEFLSQHALATVEKIPPRRFIGRVFDDILDAVHEDSNYATKYTFDRFVFQKFIAIMFVNYATTDPMFYGTSRDDYGVSTDKNMSETPLYQAVARALRTLEREWETQEAEGGPGGAASGAIIPPTDTPSGESEDLSFLFQEQETEFAKTLEGAGHTVDIPFGAGERMLLEPLTRVAEALRLLRTLEHDPRAGEVRKRAGQAAQQIFRALQELKIISPLASDPTQDVLDD